MEVFPVPDCAWAITSLPCTMGAMALCWIAEGFSKPNWYTPRSRGSLSAMASKDVVGLIDSLVSKDKPSSAS